MSNVELDNLSAQNEQIFKALVIDDQVSTLPESLFVQNFLPFFCGERDIASNAEVIPYWFAIAGSPTKEVEIIDDSGNSLYKVPALSDTSIIDPVKEKGNVNFGEIVSLTKLYTNQSPTAGENFINKQLADKFYKLTAKSDVFSENEKRWVDIFARYGKIKINDQVQDSGASSGKLGDDELEF